MHHPTDRITHTTAFVTPVAGNWLEREVAEWVENQITVPVKLAVRIFGPKVNKGRKCKKVSNCCSSFVQKGQRSG